MNNNDFKDQAIQYALGTLDREQVPEFEGLLKRDPELQEFVHEWQKVNEMHASEGELMSPPIGTYSSIMEEIEALDDSESVVVDATEAFQDKSGTKKVISFSSYLSWGIAACLAFVVALDHMPSDSDSNAMPYAAGSEIVLTELAQPEMDIDVAAKVGELTAEEQRILEMTGLAEAYWFSRESMLDGGMIEDEEVASLVSPDGDEGEVTGGFTVFDRNLKMGFIGIENLPKKTNAKSYYVWAVQADGKSKPMKAGTLPVGEESRGLFFFDLSSEDGEADLSGGISFFITEEASELATAPTGRVVLSGI